ncbi:tail assembly protein [bacterium]|nr:tail assembly protein [bacterium]
MKNIIFEGFIGDKYGREWNIRANRVTDAIACLEANYPESRKELIDFVEAGGNFSIQVGEDFIGEDELLYNITKDTIIITPIPAGAKSGGAKIIAGIALLAFAWWALPFAGALAGAGGAVSVLGAGTIAGGVGTAAYVAGVAGQLALAGIGVLGVSLATTGLAQLMAPDPSVDTNDSNYLFEGPENTVASGVSVPVLFGEMIVGGVVISSGAVSGAVRTLTTYGSSDRTNNGGGTTPTVPGTPVIDTNNTVDPTPGQLITDANMGTGSRY